MDSNQVQSRIYEFLCRNIEIVHCQEMTGKLNLYEFNPAREYLFSFKLFGNDSVGASEYIAVNRESGEVRYLGFHGE